MGAARDVSKGLVDGNPLDEGREIADHFDGGVAQPLVFPKMPTDESKLRAELARLPSRHAAADPEGLGFVGSGNHNPSTDGNGSAAQRRVKQLLYRGIESIQVRMEDGGCRCHPDRSPVTFRRGSRREDHNENKDNECSLKSQCTTGPERRITRWEHEHLLEAVQQRLDANPQAMRQRRETVEHPFGTIKARMGATHFLTKTLRKVAAEMALSVLADNLTRVMNTVGIKPLIAATTA